VQDPVEDLFAQPGQDGLAEPGDESGGHRGEQAGRQRGSGDHGGGPDDAAGAGSGDHLVDQAAQHPRGDQTGRDRGDLERQRGAAEPGPAGQLGAQGPADLAVGGDREQGARRGHRITAAR
jgi:hypothetical protein